MSSTRTRKFKVMEDVVKTERDPDTYISFDTIIIPAGTVLTLEEVNDLDEMVWKVKTGQNICSRCGGTGAILCSKCHSSIEHLKPCPDCR